MPTLCWVKVSAVFGSIALLHEGQTFFRFDYLLIDSQHLSSIDSLPIYQGLASNIFIYNFTSEEVARISEYYKIRPESQPLVKPYALWSRELGLVMRTEVASKLERRKNLGGKEHEENNCLQR